MDIYNSYNLQKKKCERIYDKINRKDMKDMKEINEIFN